MSFKRFSAWFKTDFGRNFAHGGMIGLNGVGIVYHFTPQTVFLTYYTDAVHLYDQGTPVPVPAQIQAKFEKCLEILKVEELYRRVITPFSVCGFDVFNAGTTATRCGAVVGIPTNFNYKSTDDIDKENIRVNLQTVDWSSEEGQKLEEALVLPDEVQMFALCREILQAQTYQIYLNTLYGISSFIALYGASMYYNRKLQLFDKPPMVRYTMYSIMSLFVMGVYFLAKDSTHVAYEKSVDKTLADLGPEYIDSGIVFYDKILKRNQALHVLMGKEGESKYSKLGNENFFIRNVRVPIMQRKQYFETRKKALETPSTDK